MADSVKDPQGIKVRWMIDPAPPLAIMEDTEEGWGVCEIWSPGCEQEVAQHIVDLHNSYLERR